MSIGFRIDWNALLLRMACAALALYGGHGQAQQQAAPPASATSSIAAPAPLLRTGKPVDWWFVFKLNTSAFPGCGGPDRACPFGGEVQNYRFGQQFLYGSSEEPTLQKGGGCVGETTEGPLGATFDQVYNASHYYYVLWNDQFYGDPFIAGCTMMCASPWGHSKGMLAWNDAGEGFVLQVTTPSWPAAGSKQFPRKTDGNTLGCVRDDDVKVSQHFFSLRLNADDVVAVLHGLQNASVATDPANRQIVHNGGPAHIRALVAGLGKKSRSTVVLKVRLSTGVALISKPSALHVPPWQMVSSLLGGVALRSATWWTTPKIDTTQADTPIACWDESLQPSGPVEIATTGQWMGSSFGLRGGPGSNFNHAKIGVSVGSARRFSVFGDMNQTGSLSGPDCSVSQNGRGGLFFVVENAMLAAGIASLLDGETAPEAPSK
ncbi:MAG: deoxyribonuclease II family protein [Variovorax sp.]